MSEISFQKQQQVIQRVTRLVKLLKKAVEATREEATSPPDICPDLSEYASTQGSEESTNS